MANYPQSVQGGRSLRFCVLSALWESSRVYGYGGRRYLYSQRPRRPCLVKKRSTDLLHDPWYNKVVSSISRAFQKHSNESLIMSLGQVESLSIHSVWSHGNQSLCTLLWHYHFCHLPIFQTVPRVYHKHLTLQVTWITHHVNPSLG